MPKKKRLGYGTTITIDGGAVGQVISITPGERSRDEVDVTDMDSTAMESLDSDPPNYGSLKVSAHWDPSDAGDKAIDDLFDETDPDDRLVSAVLTTPDGSTRTHSVRIMKITPSAIAIKDRIVRDIEMKIQAKPTYSAPV